MAETESNEVFYPGNTALVSDQHDELVASLKELTGLPGVTRQERAIVRMAIDLLDYMKEYALGPTNEEYKALSQEQKRRLLDAIEDGPKTFTVHEFHEDLICSGGVELLWGRCTPRF